MDGKERQQDMELAEVPIVSARRRRWGFVSAVLLMIVTGCSRPSDIFLPIVVGEATAAPTILDTPNATPTALAVTPTPTLRVTTPTAAASSVPATRQPGMVTPSGATRSPGTGTPVGTPIARQGQGGVTTPIPVATVQPTPTVTPTTQFYSFFAQIFTQLQPTATATLPPVPIVLTPTPRPVTATPTSLPTNTPTPFTGSVRLLARDPVVEKGLVDVVAYAVPDGRIDKSWSAFYALRPQNSDLVRIYASDSSRTYDPVLALTSTDQWAEGVCMVGSTMVGVQFWGDENDGWARVLVDGTERWRGNTYGRSPELFVRFLEIRDLKKAPHVIRIEPLGQAGTTLPGGNSHVSIYAVVCGMPAASEIYVPILQR